MGPVGLLPGLIEAREQMEQQAREIEASTIMMIHPAVQQAQRLGYVPTNRWSIEDLDVVIRGLSEERRRLLT